MGYYLICLLTQVAADGDRLLPPPPTPTPPPFHPHRLLHARPPTPPPFAVLAPYVAAVPSPQTLRFPHRTTCVLNPVLSGRRTVYVCSDCMSKFSPVGVPPSGVVVALVVLSFYNLQFYDSALRCTRCAFFTLPLPYPTLASGTSLCRHREEIPLPAARTGRRSR